LKRKCEQLHFINFSLERAPENLISVFTENPIPLTPSIHNSSCYSLEDVMAGRNCMINLIEHIENQQMES
jgi:hypothetical protein